MKLKQDAFTTPRSTAGIDPTPSLHHLIRRKKFGSFIVDYLHDETTEAEIIEKLRPIFDVPGKEVEEAVADMLADLRKIGVLDE